MAEEQSLAERFGLDLSPVSQQPPASLAERFGLDDLTPPPLPIEQAPPEVQQAQQQANNQYETLAQARFKPEQIEEWKNKGPIGFFEALDFLDYKEVLPGGGLYQAADTYTLYQASKKMEAGDELTVNEEMVLNEYINKQVEMGVRGLSVGGGISYGVAQMPAFMVEFAASGGVGKSAQKATKEFVEKKIENKLLATVAGGAARVATQTAVSGYYSGEVVAGYGERRLNDRMAITDLGEAIMVPSKETPGISAVKALGGYTAEMASEMTGPAIGKYVVGPVVTKTGKVIGPRLAGVYTPAMQKIPANIRAKIYDAYLKINKNAKVDEVFSVGGFHGVLEELGEERVSAILREGLNLAVDEEYTMQDYLSAITPSPEDLLVETGIITIAGGTRATAKLATNLLAPELGESRAKEAVANMTAQEQQDVVANKLKENEKAAQAEGIDDSQTWFDRHYEDMINRVQPIEDVEKKAEEVGAAIPTDLNPRLHARNFAGMALNIQDVVERNTTALAEDGTYEITGKGLKPILQGFQKSMAHIEPDGAKFKQDFDDYSIAMRMQEDLAGREEVELDPEQFARYQARRAEVEAKYADEWGMWELQIQEVQDFRKRVGQEYLVNTGLMPQEDFDEMWKENPYYVPFQRVLDDLDAKSATIGGSGKMMDANAKAVIKRLHGSKRDIKSPTEQTILQTARIIELGTRNRVARSVTQFADVLPQEVERIRPKMKPTVVKGEQGEAVETFRPTGMKPKGNVVGVFEEGKQKYYRVSEPLYRALENMSPYETGLALNWLRTIFKLSANTLRVGATMIPEFWARNIIRDPLSARIQADVRPGFVDVVKGLAHVLKKDTLYREWQRNGGAMNSFMDMDEDSVAKMLADMLDPKGKLSRYKTLKAPILFLEDVSMALEEATRVGTYEKARKKGMSGMAAAFESREATLDFARGGTSTRQMNRYIPFLNVGVQGVDKLLRTFKHNPGGTMAYGFATLTMPSVLIAGYYLYGAPEDERQEYLEIPQWQRDLFWCYKANGRWWRIPKPFSLGYIFGSVPERFMVWGYKGDKPEMRNFWSELARGVGGTLSPVYDLSSTLPPIVKLSVETVTNWNFFLGREVYPAYLEDMSPRDRKTKYTTDTSVFLTDQLRKIGLDWSPAMVDNALRGQLGGSAAYVTDAGDQVLKAFKEWNGEELPEEVITPSDLPLIRAFAVRDPSGFNTNSGKNFFETYEKVGEVYRSAQKHKDNLDEQEAFLGEGNHQAMYDAYKPMRDFYEEMREIGKITEETAERLDMSKEEKAEIIKENNLQIWEIAVEANKWYKQNVEEAGSK